MSQSSRTFLPVGTASISLEAAAGSRRPMDEGSIAAPVTWVERGCTDVGSLMPAEVETDGTEGPVWLRPPWETYVDVKLGRNGAKEGGDEDSTEGRIRSKDEALLRARPAEDVPGESSRSPEGGDPSAFDGSASKDSILGKRSSNVGEEGSLGSVGDFCKEGSEADRGKDRTASRGLEGMKESPKDSPKPEKASLDEAPSVVERGRLGLFATGGSTGGKPPVGRGFQVEGEAKVADIEGGLEGSMRSAKPSNAAGDVEMGGGDIWAERRVGSVGRLCHSLFELDDAFGLLPAVAEKEGEA